MKRCYYCGDEKPLTEFNRDCTKSDGRATRCRYCHIKYKAEWQRKNADKARKYGKRWYGKHREQKTSERQLKHAAKEAEQALRREHRKCIKSANKRICVLRKCCCVICGNHHWQARHKKYCSRSCKTAAYRQTENGRNNERARDRTRYRTCTRYRLRKIMDRGIRRGLSERVSTKAFDVLPYSVDELRHRLLSTMPDGFTWCDFMSGALHIDHIQPVSSFNITSVDCPEFKKCWSLGNLQLLPAVENMRKGAGELYKGTGKT